jgi:hypothetical protein
LGDWCRSIVDRGAAARVSTAPERVKRFRGDGQSGAGTFFARILAQAWFWIEGQMRIHNIYADEMAKPIFAMSLTN